jgi:hypothetical protein
MLVLNAMEIIHNLKDMVSAFQQLTHLLLDIEIAHIHKLKIRSVPKTITTMNSRTWMYKKMGWKKHKI